jgi:branched-subunit amino acid ABC-type transport system permease component
LGALAVTLVYSVLRFSNFAQGDSMAFGTMIVILLTGFMISRGWTISGIPTALLVIPIAIVFTSMYLLTMDRLIYRHYRKIKAKSITIVMSSIGVMFVTGGIVRFVLGASAQRFGDGERFIFSVREFKAYTGLEQGIAFKTSQFLTITLAILLVSFLFYFLQKTKTGKAMRAYSDNKELALLSGIDPDKVVQITWLLAALFTTIAGTLYGLDKGFAPQQYHLLLLPIFASVIVGGIGSPLGAIAGAFLVAFSEVLLTYAYKKFLIYLLPLSMHPSSLVQLIGTEYKYAISFVILVIVLLIKPTGLFKGKVIVDE